MYIETIIEIIEVFCTYFAMIILLPAFMLKPIVRKKSITERFMFYLVTGNVYIIYVVFTLAFLKILYSPVFILTICCGAVAIRTVCSRMKKEFPIREAYLEIRRLVSGEYGIRLYIRKKWKTYKGDLLNWLKALFYHRIIEWTFFICITIFHIYHYGYHTMRYVSFGAYDEEVHLYWVQSMLIGKIFPSGLYPHGFHNVLGGLTLTFGVDTITIIRVAGVISTTFIMTMLYFGMRKVCRLKYAVLFVFFVFPFLDMDKADASNRFQYTIPQEYAMIFLIPMALYLFAYLKEKKKSDLVLFSACFSLTLLIHFYVTIIAGILCVSIGLVYFVKIIREKLLSRLILSGLIGIFAALLPLLVGFAMGYEFEQSMNWAAGVMTGAQQNTVPTATEKPNPEAVVEEIPNTYFGQFKKEAKRILEKYVFNHMAWLFLILLIIIVMLLSIFLRLISKKLEEKDRYQLCFLLFSMVLIFMLFCRALKLPSIMEEKRVGIFLFYFTPLFFALPFDLLYVLVGKNRVMGKIYSAMITVAAVVCSIYTINSPLVRKFEPFYYFQPTGTMKAVQRIMKTYKKDTWTVVSSVNENSIVLGHGFHFEINDFMVRQEYWKEKTQIRIPTKYVFVFVEKLPIQFFGFWLMPDDYRFRIENRIRVDEKYGKEVIHMNLGSDSNYTMKRIELMSKAYYWAQEYQKSYPDEMNVYYEDEEVVVYRIVQNEYFLNNFAIDYGLNMHE